MRRGDFYNTKPRLYRRRNRVTTLWGNGVVSLLGGLNLISVSLFCGWGLSLSGGLWWEAVQRWRQSGQWEAGLVIGGIVTLPLLLLCLRYLIRVWGLWWLSVFTRLGRRLMVFNSRRIWIRGFTPRFGKPWSEVEVRFLRKRYALTGPLWIGHGLKTKFYINGCWKAFREWDVGLLTGRDLQTLLLYELWRYQDRTGDKRWRLSRKAYSDNRPDVPYPEGYD